MFLEVPQTKLPVLAGQPSHHSSSPPVRMVHTSQQMEHMLCPPVGVPKQYFRSLFL